MWGNYVIHYINVHCSKNSSRYWVLMKVNEIDEREWNWWTWMKLMKVKLFSYIQLFATPRTVAHQAPLSMKFSRQEYQSGLPFPSPGDFPHAGIEPGSSALQVDALPSELLRNPDFRYFDIYCQIALQNVRQILLLAGTC